MKNKNLHLAKKAKKDKFYTQLTDIEKELRHYKPHFENKVVYCNCDDPQVSNFFQYFSFKFKVLKLRKLIASCYKNQNPDLFSQNESDKAIYLEYKRDKDEKLIPYPEYMKFLKKEPLYRGDKNNPNIPAPEDIGIGTLKGDGDFRSEECIRILKQADIVVTNPPFSLFREYVAQLIAYDKKFLIIGHQNAITYKEIFKLIKENKIWLGYGFLGGAGHFIAPNYKDHASAGDHKQGMIRVSGVHWFTNLDTSKRNEELILCKKYNPEEYPKYDNYNAINVDKTKDIPMDYEGVMGVPITFVDKYNPEQFEIIGSLITNNSKNYSYGVPYINGKKKYARILIKNKKVKKAI